MLLFTCETGQGLTYEFIKFDNEINQMDWNFLPIKVQRLLPTIMINTQQPLEILCFGSTACGRETFKKVNLRREYKNKKKLKGMILYRISLFRLLTVAIHFL